MLELFEEDAVAGDLAERLAVGAAAHRDGDGAARAVAREPDDPDVVAEVLAAELCADPRLLREREHLRLELDVAEAVTEQRAGRRQRVEVAGARQLGRLECRLGRRAADDDGEVVRRAGRRAERLHLLEDPRQQRLLVEQCLRLLEQVALVGRAAALRHEEELVGVAVDGGDLDLGRQVVAGVALLVHVDRCHLAVAEVARQVRLVDAAGDGGLVAATGEHELPLLRLHDGGARVLAHRQDPTGGDVRVLQQVEGHEPVVRARFRIVDDGAQLLEMTGPEQMGDVAHRFAGDQRECVELDRHELAVRLTRPRFAYMFSCGADGQADCYR